MMLLVAPIWVAAWLVSVGRVARIVTSLMEWSVPGLLLLWRGTLSADSAKASPESLLDCPGRSKRQETCTSGA